MLCSLATWNKDADEMLHVVNQRLFPFPFPFPYPPTFIRFPPDSIHARVHLYSLVNATGTVRVKYVTQNNIVTPQGLNYPFNS